MRVARREPGSLTLAMALGISVFIAVVFDLILNLSWPKTLLGGLVPALRIAPTLERGCQPDSPRRPYQSCFGRPPSQISRVAKQIYGRKRDGIPHRSSRRGAPRCALTSGPALARDGSVDDFYSGKTVELYIGYSVGGGYDTYARLLARQMGEHRPGNPENVSVKQPGAGSLKLANWLAEAAPRDGTVFGAIARAAPFDPFYGNEAADFEARDLN